MILESRKEIPGALEELCENDLTRCNTPGHLIDIRYQNDLPLDLS